MALVLAVPSFLALAPARGALRQLPEGPAAPEPARKEEARTPFPQIGESLDALTARYGEGLKNAFKIRLPGNDQYYWEMNSLGLNVVIQNGKAVLIVAHRLGGRVMTNDDVRQLLAASSDIYGWMEDQSSPRWVRRDNKLEAFRELHHEDMFFIQNIDAARKSGSTVVPGSR